MASCALHLLVTLLAFSRLVPFYAVATSRTLDFSYDRREILAFEDINQTAPAEMLQQEDEEIGMNFLSKNDYPGSGANNHHTPKPPATWEGGKS